MVKDSFTWGGLKVVLLGLGLPTLSSMASGYVPATVKNMWHNYVPYSDSKYMKALTMVGGTAAVAFALQHPMLKVITYNEAMAATGIAMGLVAVSLAQSMYNGPGAGLLADMPTSVSLQGMAGYGGYYGYLGSAHDGMYGDDTNAVVPMGTTDDLFGVKTNVF